MTLILWLRRYWRPLAVLLLLLAVWLHGDHHGDTRRDREWSARWHQHVAEDSQQVAASSEAARVREQETLAAWSAANDIQHQELTHVQAHRDRLLADLRAGRLRLPSACPAQVPAAAADPGQPQGAEEGGQSAMAGELVNRLAVCDEVASERNQAVRLLEGITAAGSR